MAEKRGKILVVDDNEDILFSLKLLLKNHVQLIHTLSDPQKIPQYLSKENYDLILLDMNFHEDVISGQEGFFWLKKILEIDPSAVVIFITAYGDVEKSVQAIKAGATDFVLKPWQNERLLATIAAGFNLRQSRLEASNLRVKQRELNAALDQPYHDFIGQSPEMKKVFETIAKVAPTDANVLILGENGTGKELAARALYRQSPRQDEVFVSVDMGAIPENLFESELFGHVKGAFTDAKKDRPGRFEIASGGTLFLDEIGNLSLSMQAKLLTIIEKRQIARLGSNKVRDIDVRLICATNMPIQRLVGEQRFRQDLLYRINTVEIHLPPLRERVADILLLSRHFLRIYCKKYQKNIKGFSAAVMKKLEHYNWPGNVRELQHTVERAVILSDSTVLQADDLLLSAEDCYVENLELDTYNLEKAEKIIIQRALRKHKGNISHAAKELGLTRTSLYRRLDKYGL